MYAQPSFVLEVAARLAAEKGVTDARLTDPGERKPLLEIGDILRASGILANQITEGYVGRRYQIMGWGFGPKPYFLVPLKIEAFGTRKELERRRKGVLENIYGVRWAFARKPDVT